jgi:hypothetical protein
MFDCSHPVQEVQLSDGTIFYFQVRILKIKGDAHFLQILCGNQGDNADEACFLCDASRKLDIS